MSRYSHRRRLIAALAFGLGLAALPRPALSLENGSLTVQWDANTTDSDLSGYRVFLSTDSSVFSLTPAAAQSLATTRAVSASTTQTTFSALDTTKVYYIAVTCFDLSGNESVFSNVVSTQPSTTPTLAMVSPSFAAQGSSNLAVTLDGSNFQTGVIVSFGPGITVTSLDAGGVPTRLIASLDIDPLAEVDTRDVVITNPGNISLTKANAFEVRLDLGRVDINQSNRIDGGDMISMAPGFTARAGDTAYSTNFDLNVDGVVDAMDLSLLLSYFGMVGPF